MIALLLASALANATPTRGAQVYAAACASCHGAGQSGTAEGPSLHRVGLGAVDFYLMSGRMPASIPGVEIGSRDERAGQRLALDDIRALEDYLAPVVAGGPPIPVVTTGGNLTHGQALYALNCEQCHGVQADGGSIGGLDWAPSLHRTSIDVVADAIRVGPEEMPRFSEHQLPPADLDDLASYVWQLQRAQPIRPPFRSTGPVPEGAVGYLTIIALVAFVFTFWRIDTPAPEREEVVRSDEGADVVPKRSSGRRR